MSHASLSDKSHLVGTVVLRDVWSEPGKPGYQYGPAYTKHNLVVNGGRNYVAQFLYDSTYNHKIKFIQAGTGSTTPSQDNTQLEAPVGALAPYNSVTGPGISSVGQVQFSWVLLGSFFGASYYLQEFGLFIEDAGNPGNPLLLSGLPLMFSRVVISAPIQVYPWNGVSEKGISVDWFIQL